MVTGIQRPLILELDSHSLRRAQAGNRQAQEAFVRTYAGPIHALVRRCGVMEADDLCQEILRKLLTVLPRFDETGPAPLSAWVVAIAHRAVIDFRRKRHLALAPERAAEHIADESSGLYGLLEAKQLSQALEVALASLPELHRRVFVLAHIHEQPLAEVARIEEVPVGTIKSRLHRARAQLAQLLVDWRPGTKGARGGHHG